MQGVTPKNCHFPDGIFKALIFLPTVQAVFILLYFVVIVFGLTGKVSSKINTELIFVKNVGEIIFLNYDISKLASKQIF